MAQGIPCILCRMQPQDGWMGRSQLQLLPLRGVQEQLQQTCSRVEHATLCVVSRTACGMSQPTLQPLSPTVSVMLLGLRGHRYASQLTPHLVMHMSSQSSTACSAPHSLMAPWERAAGAPHTLPVTSCRHQSGFCRHAQPTLRVSLIPQCCMSLACCPPAPEFLLYVQVPPGQLCNSYSCV